MSFLRSGYFQWNVLVNADDEDGLVLVKQALELVEVDGYTKSALVLRAYGWRRRTLGSGFAPHFCLNTGRLFKGKLMW